MAKTPVPITCCSPKCGKETDSVLKCPICAKTNVSNIFCSQTCFRTAWEEHKVIHPAEDGSASYDPFKDYEYSGKLRAVYPLTPRRAIPKHIKRPDYSEHGKPLSEIKNDRSNKIAVLTAKEITAIRKTAKVARAVLDVAAAAIKPGITTDELDAIVHRETINRNAYPSPLNYYNFPKSVCTSVNEIICHGIPDARPLEDGDIVNLDITVYYLGFHADMNETYYVGDKAKANPEVVNLVETTRECLDLAIATVKPGVLFRSFGEVIEEHATKNGCSVVRTYCGHGINLLFHCQPSIPHYAKNKTIGIAKPGMVFTIEPMLCVGSYRDIRWPDNWTAATADGSWSAQFEHMLLVTEDGVEVLSGRAATSPGGAIARI